MSKKHLTQKALDKMTPEEVMAISPDQIKPGFDVIHEDGVNPKLIEEEPVELKDAPTPQPETEEVKETSEAEEETQEEVDEYNKPHQYEDVKEEDNKGILFLRFFKKDESNGKILTRLKRKVYFPKDHSIEPGWYIATILEERNNHGIMDTIPLSEVADSLWNPRYIKGIYVHRNHKDNQLEIYPAIPKDQLHIQQPTLIWTVKLPDPYQGNGATIGEILEAKKAQADSENIG